MPFADLDGSRIYYEQHGNPDGDYIVFVRGACAEVAPSGVTARDCFV